MEAAFATHTLSAALQHAERFCRVPHKAKTTRAKRLSYLLQLAQPVQDQILHQFQQSPGTKRKAPDGDISPLPRKQRRALASPPREADGPEQAGDVDEVNRLINSDFLTVPPSHIVDDCISRFIDRTGNAALTKQTCVVCSRKLWLSNLRKLSYNDIPNKHLLQPTHPHQQHNLVDGSLFDSSLARHDNNYVCDNCWHSLMQHDRPRLSLANNMWIGDLPFQLAILTFPELLISLYFPAAYIIKIYPRNIRRLQSAETVELDAGVVNSKLRGNVSSFRLPTSEIADMAGGSMVPKPSLILAAIIGVTFVGVGKRSLGCLSGLFRVRRQRVYEALLWLKENNRLYRDMTISQENLRTLPEDGVPPEIMDAVRFSSNIDAVGREHAGYANMEGADEDNDMDIDEELFSQAMELDTDLGPDPSLEAEEGHTERGSGENLAEATQGDDADVFPLMAHGVLDVGGDSIPEATLFAHAVENLIPTTHAQDYGVRKGNAFINEFGRRDENHQRFDGGPENPNHLLGTFPMLFPYGCGGFEVDRAQTVTYEEHVKWALQHTSGRFRRHPFFMFLVFGVLWKRRVCRSAALQIEHSEFLANHTEFLKLTPKDFVTASEEENANIAISNPAIRTLRKHLSTVRSRVEGTDENRTAIRAQIWDMTLKFNPPTIWTTINLSDSGDPIAQVLAGEAIDLDRFAATAGPTATQRTQTIGADPFAAAEYFHLVVNVLLKEMLGISVGSRGAVTRKVGVLGPINAYVGTVEAQGRGSLHLHILFWLKDAPTANAMQRALQSPRFREKIRHFIRHNIRADVSGDIMPINERRKIKTGIAFSRPLDPRVPGYTTRFQETERRNASVLQAHECTVYYCLKNKNGRQVCKRGHPWPTYAEDWVDDNGNWGPKRRYSFLNAWNPPIFSVTRSNMDIKLLTNSWETKNIAFYITLYIAKKQVQAANASAVLSGSSAFTGDKTQPTADNPISKINKKLLQQCANTLSRQHELSGPEVVSYLMGWGDRFISHTFVKLYWDSMVASLQNAFPSLKTSTATDGQQHRQARISLEEGRFIIQDQLGQYTDRGEGLEHMSLYDFFLRTYHDGHAMPTDVEASRARKGPGRPANVRHAYLATSERKGSRVVRGESHETAIHIVGRWIPSKDDPNQENHCAQLLMLLKPWRQFLDLLGQHSTFAAAKEDFLSTCPSETQRVVENVEYYHECSSAARRRRSNETPLEPEDYDDNADIDHEHTEQGPALAPSYTESDVREARYNKVNAAEAAYGARAMDIAVSAGMLKPQATSAAPLPPLTRATASELSLYREWEVKVAALTRNPHLLHSNDIQRPPRVDPGKVLDSLTATIRANGEVLQGNGDLTRHRTEDQLAAVQILNAEQWRAHDIVEQHLRNTLTGIEQPQLLMIVQGEGGTGKTVMLNAISHTFDFLEASHLLAKTGTTGISASLIRGQTLHQWAALPIYPKMDGNWILKASKKSRDRRIKNIQPTKYLFIDEFSMLTKKVLAMLSQVIGPPRGSPASRAFGGINVILVGDPHQFPPVGNPRAALYNSDTDDDMLSQQGLSAYRQFDTVITLTEQNRVQDPVWNAFLQRLRKGQCHEEDLNMLQGLFVTRESNDSIWGTQPWADAVLVTPRHTVRTRWNSAALLRHRSATGNAIYISTAEDTAEQPARALTIEERVVVASSPDKKTGKLPEHIELSVGMKAMVLWNIATEADLANGTRGTIVDVKLDPREPDQLPKDREGRCILQYPPAVVLIHVDEHSFQPFESLPPGVLPITPTSASFTIATSSPDGVSIKRRQYAVTPGYAFTDYKSQGQTIPYVIVDLESPPHGKLTPFNAYVALSRSKGRESIRILRGFDPKIFTTHPSERLREEDERLDMLTRHTKRTYQTIISMH